MSTLEIQNQIRNSPAFKAGEPFYLTQIGVVNQYPRKQVREAAQAMVRARELTYLNASMYQSRLKCAELVHGPWRTVSNEELGIEPQRLGAF